MSRGGGTRKALGDSRQLLTPAWMGMPKVRPAGSRRPGKVIPGGGLLASSSHPGRATEDKGGGHPSSKGCGSSVPPPVTAAGAGMTRWPRGVAGLPLEVGRERTAALGSSSG